MICFKSGGLSKERIFWVPNTFLHTFFAQSFLDQGVVAREFVPNLIAADVAGWWWLVVAGDALKLEEIRQHELD